MLKKKKYFLEETHKQKNKRKTGVFEFPYDETLYKFSDYTRQSNGLIITLGRILYIYKSVYLLVYLSKN